MEGSFSVILVMALFATSLLRPGLAEAFMRPRFPFIHGSHPVDYSKCWSSLFNVQGCEIEIFKAGLTGKFENVGSACCKAFTEVDAKCWPKMFPLNPLFPHLLKDGCSRIGAAAPAPTIPQLPVIIGSSNLTKCLPSLSKVQGCVTEIYKSVSSGKFGSVGPKCCKAFSAMDAKCWPHMFPLNPLFLGLLKSECPRINAQVK